MWDLRPVAGFEHKHLPRSAGEVRDLSYAAF
jgi:hypothetical protein